MVAPALAPQAPALVPPVPRPATQQVAQAAAAAQMAEPVKAPPKPQPAPSVAPPPALDTVLERWSDVSEMIRRNGRGMVAQAVQWLRPLEVTNTGMLVLGYAHTDDTWARAAESARGDIMAALQGCFEGVTGFSLRAQHASGNATADSSNARRITAHDVKKEKLDALTASDPLLDAAVRALDLELRD